MVYKIIRKSRWKLIKISRIYFNSILQNTRKLLVQQKCEILIADLANLRKQLRILNKDFRFCFDRHYYATQHYSIIKVYYYTIRNDNFAIEYFNNSKVNFLWLLRMQQLFRWLYVYYVWLLKKIQASVNSLTISRKNIEAFYLRIMRKQLDDTMIASSYGFRSTFYRFRRYSTFNKKPRGLMLSWYQGIKFGTFVSFRSRFEFRCLRDRRRRKKLVKDYQKKLKKYKHSVNENMRLVHGKRKKPKKKHIVYYK